MSLSEYSDSSDFIPEPHCHLRLSRTELSRALFHNSTPCECDFNPKLGPIRRPKSSTAGKGSPKRARPHEVYSCGDMSNLRPDDRGMDAATCLEFYRMSTASGEQEPPINTAAGSSSSDASTKKKVTFDLGAQLATPSTEEEKAKVRTRGRELDRNEALAAMAMRDLGSEELGEDDEITRRTRECTLANTLDGINARESRMQTEQSKGLERRSTSQC